MTLSSPPDLLRDPIPAILRHTGVPAVTGMLFGTLYNIIDTIYAGLLSTKALAAFSLSFPIYFVLLIATAIGFSNGLKAVIAYARGQGDDQKVGALIVQGVALAVLLGLSVNLTAFFMLDQILALFSSDPETLSLAKSYLQVIILGGTIFNLLYALIAPLGAIGDTRSVRNGEIIGAIANALLNPILMFGWFGFPALGVAGLALSTVLIWVGFSLYVLCKLRKSPLWKLLCFRACVPAPGLWKQILLQAIPGIFSMCRVGVMFSVFTMVISSFGSDILAGYGVGFRIEGLVILPVIGLNAAAVAVVAHNYGACDIARIHTVYRVTLNTGLAMMLIGAVLIYAFAPYIIIPFTDDPKVQASAIQYLRIEAFSLPSIACINLGICILQGMQKSLISITILVVTQVLIPLIALPWIAEHYDHVTVWWAMVATTWVSALIMLVMVRVILHRWTQKLREAGSPA